MSFLSIAQGIRDRNFGGTKADMVAEPYVSGYQYTYWKLPTQLESVSGYYQNTTMGMSDVFGKAASMADVLSATCTSVTPPGVTLNTVEFNAIGGAKYYAPGSIEPGTELSCRFTEFSGLPVHGILHRWVEMIRHNRAGTTKLVGSDYAKNNYSGTVLYWTTKPDGKTIEYAAAYSGVFPKSSMLESFSGDITSVEKVELEVSFQIDFIYTEDWVYAAAEAKAGAKPYTAGMWEGDGLRNKQGGGGEYQDDFNT